MISILVSSLLSSLISAAAVPAPIAPFAPASAKPTPAVPTPETQFCDLLMQISPTLTQAQYELLFTDTFKNTITLPQLKAILAPVVAEAGACTSANADGAILTLHTTAKLDDVFDVVVLNGKISGLRLKYVDDPAVRIRKWSDLSTALEAINSQASVGMTLKSSKFHLKYNENLAYAIGSTFKLYVLGALSQSIARGERQWTDSLAIRDDWKSLGSGAMQNLPAGTSKSLYDFAANMISISDNTAADHLLYTVGRENVEAMLAPMGNSRAELNIPFLATNELFKLKWIAPESSAAQKFMREDVSGRRRVLESLKSLPLGPLRQVTKPTDVWTIEWFGSTDDTCNAILALADQGTEVRTILSKNAPFTKEDAHWTYAGFKGGSEPGVISMTYLLETKSSRACLSVSYNNLHTRVSELRIEGLVRKALQFAETVVR